MDVSTKPIQRDSLRELIDASKMGTAKPHAHVVRRDSVRSQAVPTTNSEASALRGLVMVIVLALAVRQLLLWIL
jgi:cytochrome c-type biogenesis protein CcmH/NrfG